MNIAEYIKNHYDVVSIHTSEGKPYLAVFISNDRFNEVSTKLQVELVGMLTMVNSSPLPMLGQTLVVYRLNQY